MRELTEKELEQVSGGNPLLGGVLSIVGAYYTGKEIGTAINTQIRKTFSMSPGQAAYYTFNDK